MERMYWDNGCNERGAANLLLQFFLQFTQLNDGSLCEHDCIGHLLFRQLLSKPFDHQHRVFTSSNDQIQSAFGDLRAARHQDEFFTD